MPLHQTPRGTAVSSVYGPVRTDSLPPATTERGVNTDTGREIGPKTARRNRCLESQLPRHIRVSRFTKDRQRRLQRLTAVFSTISRRLELVVLDVKTASAHTTFRMLSQFGIHNIRHREAESSVFGYQNGVWKSTGVGPRGISPPRVLSSPRG